MREDWLKGWNRVGSCNVLIGVGVHCVCCGKSHGVTTVSFEEGFEFPKERPDWPFEEENCPLCNYKSEPYTSEQVSKLSLKVIREAIKIKKSKRIG
jgi:hypothetical protein